MNKANAFEPRDLVIHFRDLVLYVALRWRSILLVALAGAVLLGGFAYWRDLTLYGAAEEIEVVTPADPDAAGLARVATAQSYRAAYASMCAYNQSAPMMSIDFMAVHTRRMSYLVTGDCAYAAATLYSKSLESQDLYADLEEQDEDMLPAYLAELVSTKITYETSDTPAHCVFLDVEIVAPTKELCNRLSELAKETVSGLTAPVKAAAGEHTGRWAFDRYVVTGSETVRTRQLDSLQQQKQLQTDLTAAEGALTSSDRAYLNRLEKQEAEPDPDHPVSEPTLSVKKILLGFLAGFALMVLWYALRYLFCGRVLSENDLAVRQGVTVFGSLAGEQKRCAVDRLLCRLLQDKDADPVLTGRRMALSAGEMGVGAVYVVGELPAGVAEAMAKDGVALTAGEDPAISGEGMDALLAAEGLLLAVRGGVTRHNDLARTLALAKTLNRPVLGAVIQK